MCSVSCIIHQHSSGLAVSRRQLLRRVVPVISAAPASYYTVYNLSLSRHLEYLPLLPPAFFSPFSLYFPPFVPFFFLYSIFTRSPCSFEPFLSRPCVRFFLFPLCVVHSSGRIVLSVLSPWSILRVTKLFVWQWRATRSNNVT